MLEHTLKAIKGAGIEEVVMTVHYMKEAIMSKFGDGSSLGLRITYAEQVDLLGTGHALKVVQPYLGNERFLLVYGDLAFNPSLLKRMLSEEEGSNGAANQGGAILGVSVDDISEYGSLVMSGDRLESIKEKPTHGRRGVINGGIYLLQPSIFACVDETPVSERGEIELTSSINLALSKGIRFRVHLTDTAQWVDVGRPWNLLEANRILMDALVTESRIEGEVEEGAKIRGNVVVERGASVLSGSYIEGPVWVSSGCKVGPNCYLRPYTYLCRGAKVGHACEIKASIIMEDSRVGHLSYLGDSIIGSGSNIGAGTITANLRFDEGPVGAFIKGKRVSSGRKKLGAFLGDCVKTGINVSISPGVKVGYGSWISPHTALDRDVPPGMLVSERRLFEMHKRR